MQSAAGEEPLDDRSDTHAQLGGPVPAPRRVAHEERHLLRRVIAVVGLAAPLDTHVGLDQLRGDEHFHGALALTGVDADAEVTPRHRVQRLTHLDVTIGRDLGCRPRRQLEPLGRQTDQCRGFDRFEHD